MKALSELNRYFVRSISVLISGSVVAQGFNVVTALLLARMFSAEDIGIYTYIITLAYLFLPIITGRYELAIITEEDTREIGPLIKLCSYCCLILTIIVSIGIGIYLLLVDKIEEYGLSVFVIPLLLLVSGCINILGAYNNRKQEYGLLSEVTMVRAIVQFVMIALTGFFNGNYIGILIAHVVSQIFSLNKQAKTLKSKIPSILKANRQQVWMIARKYYKYPAYSMPATFVNSFSYSALNFFIESLFGMMILGYYSLSFRVLGLPLALISQNVSSVFFRVASKEYNEKGAFHYIYIKATLILAGVSVPITIILYEYSPELCKWFFGPEWEVAGEYIRILAGMFCLRFIVSPLSVSILIVRKNQVELFLQCFFIVAASISYGITWYCDFTIEIFLWMINIAYFAIYSIFWVYLYNVVKGKT